MIEIKSQMAVCTKQLLAIAKKHKVKTSNKKSPSGSNDIVTLHCDEAKAKAIRSEWRKGMAVHKEVKWVKDGAYIGTAAVCCSGSGDPFIVVARDAETLRVIKLNYRLCVPVRERDQRVKVTLA